MSSNKKVLIFRDTDVTEKSKDLTTKVIELLNEANDIYTGFGLKPIGIDDYVNIIMNQETDLIDFVRNQVAKNATALKNLEINQDAIKQMVKLPDEIDVFLGKLDSIKAFIKKETGITYKYGVVFDAIKLVRGKFHFDDEAFERYCEGFSIYTDTEDQLQFAREAEAAAPHLSKMYKLLLKSNHVTESGIGRGWLIDRFFLKMEETVKVDYNRIPHM